MRHYVGINNFVSQAVDSTVESQDVGNIAAALL